MYLTRFIINLGPNILRFLVARCFHEICKLKKYIHCSKTCANPVTALEQWQSLPLSGVNLKGKYCQCPITVMVVANVLQHSIYCKIISKGHFWLENMVISELKTAFPIGIRIVLSDRHFLRILMNLLRLNYYTPK